MICGKVITCICFKVIICYISDTKTAVKQKVGVSKVVTESTTGRAIRSGRQMQRGPVSFAGVSESPASSSSSLSKTGIAVPPVKGIVCTLAMWPRNTMPCRNTPYECVVIYRVSCMRYKSFLCILINATHSECFVYN